MNRTPIICIEKTGLATSFQDEGRFGYQRFGVVTSGPMDRYAFHAANGLVGNPLHTVCLEICITGPTLTFLHPVSFAICGANLSPSLNSRAILGWRTYKVQKGDTLTFGKQLEGNFAYLSIRGGFDVEEALGSRSTYSKAGIGTTVTKNSVYFSSNPSLLKRDRGFIKSEVQTYKEKISLRYIKGPHVKYLNKDATSTLEQQPFTFTLGDRMGYRLSGKSPIQTIYPQLLPSDPIPLGGIQIPPDGNPIVLLADRQTTGGYPRIGTVISVDIPKLVQLPVQGKVEFVSVTIEEAQNLNKKSIFSYIDS